MKLPRSIPQPGAWAQAGALFVYAGMVSFGMALAMPLIAELMRHSPRLGWLGVLFIWMAPIGGAAAIHRTAHTILDLGSKKYAGGLASSLWAGFVAWAAIILVTLTTSFVLLIIDPPPVPPDALSTLQTLAADVAHGAQGIARAIIWMVLAAYVYTLERAAGRDV